MNTNTQPNASTADSWGAKLAEARKARKATADESHIGHRVFRKGYPHFTGTFKGMWNAEFAYVDWDVDVVLGETAIVALNKLEIMADKVFELAVSAPF